MGDPQNPPAAHLPVFFPKRSRLSFPILLLHWILVLRLCLALPRSAPLLVLVAVGSVSPQSTSSRLFGLVSPSLLAGLPPERVLGLVSLKKPPSPHPLADGALILPIFLRSSTKAAAWFLLGRHSYIKTPRHHDPRTSTSLHPHLAGQSTDNRAAQTLRRAEPSGASTLEPPKQPPGCTGERGHLILRFNSSSAPNRAVIPGADESHNPTIPILRTPRERRDHGPVPRGDPCVCNYPPAKAVGPKRFRANVCHNTSPGYARAEN